MITKCSGGRPLGPRRRLGPYLDRWRTAYNIRGDRAIDLSVMPEPYVGRSRRTGRPSP